MTVAITARNSGRQTMANLGQQALAPSVVSLDLGGFSKMFAQPKAMTEDDIQEVITPISRRNDQIFTLSGEHSTPWNCPLLISSFYPH